MMKVLIGIPIVLFLCFLAGMAVLVYAETHPKPVSDRSAALVVLGAQVYPDGTLSPQLALRMEAVLQEYERKPRRIITCGARGENEPVPEGDVMRKWLLDRGVPEEHVFSECESRNTMQNLINARRFLPEGENRITVVTSDYHLPRALQMAGDAGYDADGIGSPCKPEYWLKNHLRETLSWGKYLLSRLGLIQYQ